MQLAKEMVVPSFAQQRSGEEKHPKPRTNKIQKHAINNDRFLIAWLIIILKTLAHIRRSEYQAICPKFII